jgi:hypothetical protein
MSADGIAMSGSERLQYYTSTIEKTISIAILNDGTRRLSNHRELISLLPVILMSPAIDAFGLHM